ncbi:unnamed protein product [Rotaria magnacalcarata]|nr:unnamed protein product [Rotaria magnacalcarata]
MTKRRRVTYSLDDFCNAVTAYRNKTMTSIAASKKCGVPESTIRKHKDNKTNRVGSGRPSALSVDQEQYLVALLRELQSIGVRLTREILAKITGDFMRMIKKSNKDINNPGRHWFQNFFKRNSDKLKMKKELKLERSRRDNFTEEVRSNWFSKLKGILDLNNLNARPGQIWNCDESGEYVCVPADKKFVFEQQGGTGKAFTTMLLCTSASGDVLPPLVVYAAKAVNTLWCAGGVPGTTYKCSESGWISEEIFTDWFKNLFLEQTKNIERPLLLVMDNHPAHINIDVIELAIKNQVILLCLPPHCTHALQPLDVVTLSSAKTVWKKIVSKYFCKTNQKTIRKIDMPSLFKRLMDEAFTKRQCVSGFARCGLWPFDGEVMKEKVAKQCDRSSLSVSLSTNSNETLSNNFSSTTVVQHSIDASANNSILQSENSINAMIQTDAEQESISNIAIIKNSTIAPDQSLINFVPTLTSCSTETMAFNSSNYASSMITCPLTTTELINKDENQDLLDTDGVWSTRNTAQIALPVDDIEEFSEEKPFCELTTVPIEASPFSPTTAVRSIVTSCLREMQPPPPPVTSKRVRLERRYGEEITAGSLLQELKDKKATKDAKVKQPPKKRKKDQNLTSTNNVNSSS